MSNPKIDIDPGNKTIVDEVVFLIVHISPFLYMLLGFGFSIFLIIKIGLIDSEPIIMFILGSIAGLLNPLQNKEK